MPECASTVYAFKITCCVCEVNGFYRDYSMWKTSFKTKNLHTEEKRQAVKRFMEETNNNNVKAEKM